MKIMKQLAIALLACLPVFAAGTVGVSINPLGNQNPPGGQPENRVHVITITWVGDSVTGTVPSTVININQFPQLSGYRLVSIEIQPGTPSPSANYSVTLPDAQGIDLLAGNGANLSATVASYTGSLLSPPLIASPTFNLSGNSVASAKGTINLYFAPLSQVAAARGLPATLPANNTFTGSTNVKNLNKVQYCDQFPGTTADVQIAACIAALPATGGTADARGFGAGTQSIAATVNIASTSGHIHLQLDRATIFQPSAAATNMFTIGQNGSIDGLTVQVNGVVYTGTVVQMLGGSDGTRSILSNYLICNGTITGNGPCHGTDTQLGTGTAVSFNAVNNVNASFFNSVIHGRTVGFANAYLFTANGASNSFYASNSNVLDDFGAKNATNCIHFNSNPGDVVGNQVSNGECEAATSGVGNVANCILTDGTGTNLASNFIHAVNCWDYPAATTEVNFSGTTATRNWFVMQDRNLGATPLTDNSSTKTNIVLNNGQNSSGNDFPTFRGTGDMVYASTANGHGIKLAGPDTQWNFQPHINATGDLCLTLAGVAVEWCMTNTELYPFTAGALNVGKAANPWGKLFLGTAATNNFVFTPATTTAARIVSIPDPGGNSNLSLTPCITSQRTESAADANLLTCAIPAQAGSYRVRFVLSLSAANAATLGWTITWTDAGGVAHAPVNVPIFAEANPTSALTFTTSSTTAFWGYQDIDVNNSATSIVVKLTFSGTSFTGKASATVERII